MLGITATWAETVLSQLHFHHAKVLCIAYDSVLMRKAEVLRNWCSTHLLWWRRKLRTVV